MSNQLFPFSVVSIDSHVVEPTDLWTSRLPENFKIRAPVYGRLSNSSKVWSSNGRLVTMSDEYRRYKNGDYTAEFEDIGPDDMPGRLADLDADGIAAETLHPNVGLLIFDLGDPELAMACARIYNDHVAEHYMTPRTFPNALIPVDDTELAVAEIERVASMGFRGLELPCTPPIDRPYFLATYEPLWCAASDTGLPIAMHIGTGIGQRRLEGTNGNLPPARSEVWLGDGEDRERALRALVLAAGGFAGFGAECKDTIPDLIASGVLERYPKLHFIFVEFGARWFADLLDAMDDAWYVGPGVREPYRAHFDAAGNPHVRLGVSSSKWTYPLQPSEYAKRQMHVTFMDDWRALRNRASTGVECLLWGNDYPHYEGCWPRSHEAIEQQSARAGLNSTEMAAIFGGTAAALYQMDLAKAV